MKKIFLLIMLIVSATVGAQDIGSKADNQNISPAPPRNGARGGAFLDKSGDSVLQALIKSEVPKFRQLAFYDPVTGDSLKYNLFIPRDYNPSRKYPLLLFMADASTTNKETTAPLTQGYGALVFTIDSDQARHPAFVLVPQFPDKVVVNDTFYVSPHVGSVVRLLGELTHRYSIDTDRLYTTGQSMGGMISFYLNIAHPDLFAASLFVGSQWDTSKMASFAGNKFFYIVAGGDEKAPKGKAALAMVLRQNEADFSQSEWSARLPQEVQEDSVRQMLARGNDINFITFTTGSVLPPNGGNEHMCSFDYAYKLQEVRQWLFRQKREHRSDSLLLLLKNHDDRSIMVNANRGDWHGTIANSLHAIQKAVDKGAAIATIYLTRDSLGQVIANAHPIAEPHHAIIADPHLHLTLTDLLSFAKGKILLQFANGSDFRNEILEAAEATGTQNIVILGNTDYEAGLMFIPQVKIDSPDAYTRLSNVLRNNPVAVELTFVADDYGLLERANDMLKQRTRVLVNTSADGLSGSHKDPQGIAHGTDSKSSAQQTWEPLLMRGATIIQTDQIKPLLNWLNKTNPQSPRQK